MSTMTAERSVRQIMDRLRAETAENHARAEGQPIEKALVQGAISRAGFTAYLRERLPIHASMEPAVTRLAALDARFAERFPAGLFQAENLRADLRTLGVDPAAGAPLASTARFVAQLERWAAEQSLALIGAYYVFEGSKNGARYIARAVGRALNITPAAGMRYLDPHGEAQRGLWTEFRAAWNEIEFTPQEADVIVEGARRTFDAVADIDAELWKLLGN